jgi:hypothetical protein
MNWLNLETRILHAPEYIGSDPKARATWLNVLLWAATRERSGREVGAKSWGDRQWQQTCGVTRREVLAASPLLIFEGEDLVIWSYPIDQEIEIKAKRAAGKLRAEKRWHNDSSASSSAINSASSSAYSSVHTEGKGIERERKGKELIHGAEAPQVLTLSADPESKPGPKKTRTRNPLLDALAIIDGSNVNQVTPSAWAAIGKALADIKAVTEDVTPDEIARRAAIYRAKHRDWALTPSALAKHWANCDRTSNFAPAPAKLNANEPKAWKAWLDSHRPESVYSRGNEHAEKTWAQLDRQTQDWITSQMKADEVGDVEY